MSHSSVSVRRKSCGPCFKGRRKCDLSYPTCKRCEKNNKTCHYVYPPNQKAAAKEQSSPTDVSSGSPTPDELVPIQHRKPSRIQHQLNWDGSLKMRVTGSASVPPTLGHLGDMEPVLGLGNDAWIFEQIKACPITFATETETFFIHKDLNDSSLVAGGPLRTAWGICAGCLTLNNRNRKFMFKAVDAELSKLLQPTLASTLFEDLVRLQAALLYQMIRLIYGDLEQRAAAEQQEFVLRAQNLKLLQRLDADRGLTQGDWETWLLAESIRRTAVATFKLYTLYWAFKHGMCNEVYAMVQLPISTKTGVWSSPDLFLEYPSRDETVSMRDFILLRSVTPRGSLEPFEKMVVGSCRGMD